VAEALEISPRTLGRFAEHTARVTTPGFLQKLLLRVTDIPLLARLEPVRGLLKKGRSQAGRVVLVEAGKGLSLLEALGAALDSNMPISNRPPRSMLRSEC
jgi:hypothetical protein